MKVLVIGKGGREHAIVRGLKLSPSVTEVHVAPGGPGMQKDALRHEIAADDSGRLIDFALRKDIDLVVIGPEDPLVDGLAESFRQAGIATLGPGKKAAQLEGSKVFAKDFMLSAGIPTARSFRVTSVAETLQEAMEFESPYVLKADGLAAGKGVSISHDLQELKTNAEALFEEKRFGEAGAVALLEEFQPGWEMSYLILTNGKDYESLPLSQDHKRLLDADKGPNTGGMGVVAPLKINEELEKRIASEIIEPCLAELQKDPEMDYRGVLYVGLMITEEGPKVIEFNVRFGDPETQVIFPLLEGDWGQTLLSVAKGEVPKLRWKSLSSACVVLAAAGYPQSPEMGVNIQGDVFAETASSYFLHAGTDCDESENWKTAGGRVLNSIAVGSSLKEAIENAYNQAKGARWPGCQWRQDIGQKVLQNDE